MKTVKILVAIMLTMNIMMFISFSVKYADTNIQVMLFLICVAQGVIFLVILNTKEKQVIISNTKIIDNKAENDEKRSNNCYPSLSHIGEDEYDPLTECERNYANHLKGQSSEH